MPRFRHKPSPWKKNHWIPKYRRRYAPCSANHREACKLTLFAPNFHGRLHGGKFLSTDALPRLKTVESCNAKRISRRVAKSHCPPYSHLWKNPKSMRLKIVFRSEEHTSELQSRENLVC